MKSPQRVLITGAGSGLGQALAHRFAAAGAQVACVDINLDRVQATMATLTQRTEIELAAEEGEVEARLARLDEHPQLPVDREARDVPLRGRHVRHPGA